jgi:ubiquinone/menaquinone biosynthesis C-methylase UbiE
MNSPEMPSKKFDPKHIDKLNDPNRIKIQNPDLIWEKMALTDPRVLIDIGAGTGFFTLPFSDKMEDGRVYACDISDDMLSWMKDNFPEKYKSAVVPIKMDESAVPLSDDCADLVYMANLHHELEEPDGMMAETYRLLKPGGTLMIIDWDEKAPFGPPLSIRVSEATIRSQMKTAGFENIRAYDDLPYNHFLVAGKPTDS